MHVQSMWENLILRTVYQDILYMVLLIEVAIMIEAARQEVEKGKAKVLLAFV